MNYRLSDPVKIKEGSIVVECSLCGDEIKLNLSEFRKDWQDADEGTVIYYKCRKCSKK